MAVGQEVKKWTWLGLASFLLCLLFSSPAFPGPGQAVPKWTKLVEEVEVKGTVMSWDRENKRWHDKGTVVGGDAFDLEPDENYKHLASIGPIGSSAECGLDKQVIHLETYPHEVAIKRSEIPKINGHTPSWKLPQKGPSWYQGGTDKTFTVDLPGDLPGGRLFLMPHLRLRPRSNYDYSSGEWTVTVNVTPPPGQPQPDYPKGSTFTVRGGDEEVDTEIYVQEGSVVSVISTGRITFYYLGTALTDGIDANGRTASFPPDDNINTPELREFSLIAKVEDSNFKVRDGSKWKDLEVGHHVRVKGLWVIENGHPCNDRGRGLYVIGDVFAELHPFDYTNIQLIPDLKPSDVAEESLSVAAPIYDVVYPGSWRWNCWVNEFSWDCWVGQGPRTIKILQESVRYTVKAVAHIKAPPLPDGFTPDGSLIDKEEIVRLNGTGLDKEQVRSLTVLNDGISVVATVTGTDVNEPANGRSIFQADYKVWWKSRLKAPASISITSGEVYTRKNFDIIVWNDGPDRITISEVRKTEPTGQGSFEIDIPASGVYVEPRSGISLKGIFSSPTPGISSVKLLIISNDPSERWPPVELRGFQEPLALISVNKYHHNFGSVEVDTSQQFTFSITNTGKREFTLKPIISSGDPFSIDAPLPSGTIKPSESQSLKVVFKPTQAGVSTGNITIDSDADNQPKVKLTLRGRGVDCSEIEVELANLLAELDSLDLDNPLLSKQERVRIIRRMALIGRKVQQLENLKATAGCP